MRGFKYAEHNTLRGLYLDLGINENLAIAPMIIGPIQMKLELAWALLKYMKTNLLYSQKDIFDNNNKFYMTRMLGYSAINTVISNTYSSNRIINDAVKSGSENFISFMNSDCEIFIINNTNGEEKVIIRKLLQSEKAKYRKYIYFRINNKYHKIRVRPYMSDNIDDIINRLSCLIDINKKLYDEYTNRKSLNKSSINKNKLLPNEIIGSTINKYREDDNKKSLLYDTIQDNLEDIISIIEEEETKCYINNNILDMSEDVDAAVILSDCIAYFYKNIDTNNLDKYSVSTIVIKNDTNDRQLMYFLLTDGYDSEKPYNTKDLGYKERQLLNNINLAMAKFYMTKFNVSENIVLEPLNSIPYCKLHNDGEDGGGIAIDDRPKDLPEYEHDKMVNNSIKDQLKDILKKMFDESVKGDGNIQVLQGYIDSNGNTKIISNLDENDDEEDDGTVIDLHKYILDYNNKNKDIEDYNKDIKILDVIAMFFNDVYENNFRFDFIKEQVPRNTITMINALKEFISTPLRDSILSHMTNNRFDVNPSMGFFSIFDFKIFDEYVLSFVLYYDNDRDKYKITTFYPETCSGFSIREHTLNLRNSDEAKNCSSCIIINSKFGYTVLSYDPSDLLYYLPEYSVNKSIIQYNKKFNILDNVIYILLAGYIIYMNNILLNKRILINDKLFVDTNIIDSKFSDIMNTINNFTNANIITKSDLYFLIVSLRDYIENKNNINSNISTKPIVIDRVKSFTSDDVKESKELITFDSMMYYLSGVWIVDSYPISKRATDYYKTININHGLSFYKDDTNIFTIKFSKNNDETISNLYKISKFIYINKYGNINF